MAEVLVLVDHADGEVKKVTARAADAGPPARRARRGVRRQRLRRREGVAGASTAPPRSTSPTDAELVGVPRRARRPRCSPSWSPTAAPAAVLLASGAEGKEIAGRLAVKTGSGVLTDATDVDRRRRSITAEQRSSAARRSCARRSPRARRSSRCGRTRSPPRRPPARPSGSTSRVELSDAAKGARITDRVVEEKGERPGADRGRDRRLRRPRGRLRRRTSR